jgi:hypothetical protein
MSGLLKQITDFYLGSPDFNGITLQKLTERKTPDFLPALKTLVGEGKV